MNKIEMIKSMLENSKRKAYDTDAESEQHLEFKDGQLWWVWDYNGEKSSKYVLTTNETDIEGIAWI